METASSTRQERGLKHAGSLRWTRGVPEFCHTASSCVAVLCKQGALQERDRAGAAKLRKKLKCNLCSPAHQHIQQIAT